jgi:hypothetical protein
MTHENNTVGKLKHPAMTGKKLVLPMPESEFYISADGSHTRCGH